MLNAAAIDRAGDGQVVVPIDDLFLPGAKGSLRLISAFGRLQNFFWRLTDGEGVSRSYEGNDRTSVPNFVSEERDSIVEIYMDDLPICVGGTGSKKPWQR